MVTFLQRTLTSLVHVHAGRTQKIEADKNEERFLPLNQALDAYPEIRRYDILML